MVIEFCENGNLLSYLKDNRKDLDGNDQRQPFVSSLGLTTRLKFAYEVSKGMSYLERKKVVLFKILLLFSLNMCITQTCNVAIHMDKYVCTRYVKHVGVALF